MIKNVLAEKKIEVVIKQCYNINNLRGCNGLDGDGLNVDSELRILTSLKQENFY